MREGDWELRVFVIADNAVPLEEHIIHNRTVIASHPGKQLVIEVRYHGAGDGQAFQLHWNAAVIKGSTIGPGDSVVVCHAHGSHGRVESDVPPLMFGDDSPMDHAGWDWSSPSALTLQPLQIVWQHGGGPPGQRAANRPCNLAVCVATPMYRGLPCGVLPTTAELAAVSMHRSAPPLRLFVDDRMLVSLATRPPECHATGAMATGATGATTRRPPRLPPEHVDLTADEHLLLGQSKRGLAADEVMLYFRYRNRPGINRLLCHLAPGTLKVRCCWPDLPDKDTPGQYESPSMAVKDLCMNKTKGGVHACDRLFLAPQGNLTLSLALRTPDAHYLIGSCQRELLRRIALMRRTDPVSV